MRAAYVFKPRDMCLPLPQIDHRHLPVERVQFDTLEIGTAVRQRRRNLPKAYRKTEIMTAREQVLPYRQLFFTETRYLLGC
jgi:hypothetical protein